tara:strand:+ start:1045 stop:1848 length:804 start_codon:yes stop_codon:yes gene_type:complete
MGFRVKEGGSAGGTPPPTGTPNFYKEINLGSSFKSILKAVQEQEMGLGITQAPATLLTEQTIGLGVNTFASGTIITPISAGLNMGSVLNMVIPPQDETGYDIETKVYSYVGTKPIATATNTGTDNWTNVTNAQGNPDGSSATRAGQALNATSAQIRGQHVTVPYNDDVDITLVQLKFYAAQSGTALNNGGLEFAWRANSTAAWTTLVTYTGNVNFLTVSDDHDIVGLTTWAEVDAIETQVSVVLPALTATVSCSSNATVKYLEGAEP